MMAIIIAKTFSC